MDCSNMMAAYPYVKPQQFGQRYSDEDAIIRGTLFPELDLPFKDYEIVNPLPKTPMTELMELDFVCLDLRLYLDTHPNDEVAQEYYEEYRHKCEMAKQEHKESNWVSSPWPWEV